MVVARFLVLAALVACAGCAGGGAPTPGSTGPSAVAVTGTVAAAPGCPGPERADSPCPPRPVPGAAVELATTDGTVVGRATTDSAGRFRLTVAPGQYRITAHNVGYRSSASQALTVAGAVEVTLVVDSGMR